MRFKCASFGCFVPAGTTKGLSARPLETFGPHLRYKYVQNIAKGFHEQAL
jgi:hypothetical protein